ncbi:MAG: hypothetical protein GY711_22745 [bacterium]|nr:hypothetical protein [bacterium]
MNLARRPALRYLSGDTVEAVVVEAKRILAEVGIRLEHEGAIDILTGAGAQVGSDGRVRIPADIVDGALATATSEVRLYDRDGESPLLIGGDEVHFDPGSAAIKVHDYELGRMREPTSEDCVLFARLTDALPALSLQSTCVVPVDVPIEKADRRRLALALKHGRKPIITGTFKKHSFEIMRSMLECVRGGKQALRERPLAVFDCCPTSPLTWSELTCSALIGCAESGIPAELIAVPMTGATAPVTLLGSVTQHTAENLSGLAIHQLVAAGAPIVYGACGMAFDMLHGSTPPGAIESMMINSACAQVGKHLALPTHGYLGLSDSKTLDYQAGLESGLGALHAALAGVNVVSGPGMLEFVSCQSLEKLVLDHEGCAMALRAVRGVERHDEVFALDTIEEGLKEGSFLTVEHTLRWYREELHYPGSTIERQAESSWLAAGGKSAAEQAHEEVQRILSETTVPPLEAVVERELDRLLQ